MRILISPDKTMSDDDDRSQFWLEETRLVIGDPIVACEDEECHNFGVFKITSNEDRGPIWYHFCKKHMDEVLRDSDMLEVLL